MRFFALERIPNPPAWSYRLRRKSDIALNAVFTWAEVRRLEFIADKPVDARTWPFTIVKLARIHYSLERFAAIIALQRFHIYSLSLDPAEKSRVNGRTFVLEFAKKKKVLDATIERYILIARIFNKIRMEENKRKKKSFVDDCLKIWDKKISCKKGI